MRCQAEVKAWQCMSPSIYAAGSRPQTSVSYKGVCVCVDGDLKCTSNLEWRRCLLYPWTCLRYIWSIGSLISPVHIPPHHSEPPAAPTHTYFLSLLFAFCSPFVCRVFLFFFFCSFFLWSRVVINQRLFIAAVPREGVDDGRAPLTRGFEEAAVTLYPVNSEYIVLKRGC